MAQRLQKKGRRASIVWRVCLPLMAAAACGDGSLIVLGQREPRAFRFDPPAVLAELSAPAKTDNPTLSADLLEIYFTSERNGIPADIWRAERSDSSEPFGGPQLVDELNSTRTETSPIVSPDALTFWLASDRPGGLGDLDVWSSTREARGEAWVAPRNVPALSSSSKDLPRLPGQHDRVMPLASDRDKRGYYQLYFANRSAPSEAFDTPELVRELSDLEASLVDGFLSDDGLTLFYVRGPLFGPADLYVASRRALSEPFGYASALTDLNTSSDERDPWWSADGRLLFFSSDRSGQYEIYVARVRPEALDGGAEDPEAGTP